MLCFNFWRAYARAARATTTTNIIKQTNQKHAGAMERKRRGGAMGGVCAKCILSRGKKIK